MALAPPVLVHPQFDNCQTDVTVATDISQTQSPSLLVRSRIDGLVMWVSICPCPSSGSLCALHPRLHPHRLLSLAHQLSGGGEGALAPRWYPAGGDPKELQSRLRLPAVLRLDWPSGGAGGWGGRRGGSGPESSGAARWGRGRGGDDPGDVWQQLSAGEHRCPRYSSLNCYWGLLVPTALGGVNRCSDSEDVGGIPRSPACVQLPLSMYLCCSLSWTSSLVWSRPWLEEVLEGVEEQEEEELMTVRTSPSARPLKVCSRCRTQCLSWRWWPEQVNSSSSFSHPPFSSSSFSSCSSSRTESLIISFCDVNMSDFLLLHFWLTFRCLISYLKILD